MKLPVWIEEEEFVQLIKHTKSKHHKVAFVFGYGSGMRISEIAGQKNKLTYCCDAYINKKRVNDKLQYSCEKCKQEIDIKKCKPSKIKDDWEIPPVEPNRINMQNKSILIKQGKGGKDRIVPLPKGFNNAMLKLLPIKCGVRALQSAFTKAAEKSGLKEKKPEIHFHSLRHGFATRLLNQGMPINQVQLLLGHAKAATTSIYVHANPKEALSSYERYF